MMGDMCGRVVHALRTYCGTSRAFHNYSAIIISLLSLQLLLVNPGIVSYNEINAKMLRCTRTGLVSDGGDLMHFAKPFERQTDVATSAHRRHSGRKIHYNAVDYIYC